MKSIYGSLYRHAIFPFFDKRWKGRRTVEFWMKSLESQWWSLERLESLQFQALRNLLAHTKATCPYYVQKWHDLDLHPQRLESLEDFRRWPLMTREELNAHRERMRSVVPYKLIAKSTGGSTGEPLHFHLNDESNDRRTAMMYRGYGWAGGEPGTRQLHVWGTALGKVPLGQRVKAGLHRRIQRHKLLNCFDFTPERMRDHLRSWNRYRPEVIVAYTNPLYEMARFLEQEGLVPFAPRSIIVGAEKLFDFQRVAIERVFRAPVFETYGSREFMMIGGECDAHRGLHVNIENLLVEIVDDDGRPTVRGEEGNVVVTDLFNYGMPFIRYVTGDRARAGFSQCSCGRGLPLLSQVVGRRLDMLDTPDGRKIPGEFFPHLLKDFPSIRKFQVVQRAADNLRVKLVVDDAFDDAVRERLRSGIDACTGPAMAVEFEIVDHIPLTLAGKHRVVVRELPTPSGESAHER